MRKTATRRPFVTTYHGAYAEPGAVKRLYNSVMARSDVVIANSRYTAELIRSRYGTEPARIRVIHRGVDAARGEQEVERVRVAEHAREPDRAAVDQRHAPAPAEHAENGVACGHAQVAPDRELEPARDRVALDRRDHGFAEQHARRAHRAVAFLADAVSARL